MSISGSVPPPGDQKPSRAKHITGAETEPVQDRANRRKKSLLARAAPLGEPLSGAVGFPIVPSPTKTRLLGLSAFNSNAVHVEGAVERPSFKPRLNTLPHRYKFTFGRVSA
jgi:hypothetical protein